MKIIAVGSQKGGVGKSTLSIHLATSLAIDSQVVLADLDPHSRTATEWASMRESESPTVVEIDPADLAAMIAAARERGTDYLIIDLPPYVDGTTEAATDIADLVLIPVRPSFPDIKSLPRILSKIQKNNPWVVLNACHPGVNGFESGKTREARGLLEDNNVQCCPVSVSQRVAFTDALNDGRAVREFDAAGKAANEIESLVNWAKEKLGV